MAFVVYVIEIPNASIAQCKAFTVSGSTLPHEGVQKAETLLQALNGGAKDGAVQLTVRDTDPSVSTSGSGSVQETYNLK